MSLSLSHFSQNLSWLIFFFVKNSYTKSYKNTLTVLLDNTKSETHRWTDGHCLHARPPFLFAKSTLNHHYIPVHSFHISIQYNSLYLPVTGHSSDGGEEKSLKIKWLVSTAFYVLFCVIIFIIIITVVTVRAGTGNLVLGQEILYRRDTYIQTTMKYACFICSLAKGMKYSYIRTNILY